MDRLALVLRGFEQMHDAWHHSPRIVVIKDGVAFGEMWLSRTPPPGTRTAPAVVEEPERGT